MDLGRINLFANSALDGEEEGDDVEVVEERGLGVPQMGQEGEVAV